jgi:hypothetical protein
MKLTEEQFNMVLSDLVEAELQELQEEGKLGDYAKSKKDDLVSKIKNRMAIGSKEDAKKAADVATGLIKKVTGRLFNSKDDAAISRLSKTIINTMLR